MPILKKNICLFVFSFILILFSEESSARVGSRIEEDVLVLTDSLYQGRKSGSDQMLSLSSWISERFESIGLKKYEGESFFDFTLLSGSRGRNVVGVKEGTSGKYIVVMAYYDALGVKDGVLYPGADSNASGVAVMLEVARLLSGFSRDGLYDGVLFVALDGHYDSYAGAQCLLHSIPRDKIRLVVNLDTLGGSTPVDKARPRYLIALGGQRYSRLFDRCTQAGKLQMYYEYYRSDMFTNMFYRRIGDQTVFLDAGLRCVVLTSGISMSTNKPTDTPDSLDYNALRYRSLCIARWLNLVRKVG